MVRKFRDINHLKNMVSRIPSTNVLDSFIEFNMEAVKELLMPERYKLVNEKGEIYCSDCNYILQGEEKNWGYCPGCLREIACCDDPDLCDRLAQQLEESAWFLLNDLYTKTRKTA